MPKFSEIPRLLRMEAKDASKPRIIDFKDITSISNDKSMEEGSKTETKDRKMGNRRDDKYLGKIVSEKSVVIKNEEISSVVYDVEDACKKQNVATKENNVAINADVSEIIPKLHNIVMNHSDKDFTQNAILKLILFKLQINIEKAEEEEQRLLSKLEIVRKDKEKMNLEKQSLENQVLQHNQVHGLLAVEYPVSKQTPWTGLKLRSIVDLLDFSQPPPDLPPTLPEDLGFLPTSYPPSLPPLTGFPCFPPDCVGREGRMRINSRKRSRSRSVESTKDHRSRKQIRCRSISRSRNDSSSRSKSKYIYNTRSRTKDETTEMKNKTSEEKNRSLKEIGDWRKERDYSKLMSRSRSRDFERSRNSSRTSKTKHSSRSGEDTKQKTHKERTIEYQQNWKKVPSFCCDICHISVTSQVTLDSHMRGKKHRYTLMISTHTRRSNLL